MLEEYNTLKAIQEDKELPNNQVYMRRIGLCLVRIVAKGLSENP